MNNFKYKNSQELLLSQTNQNNPSPQSAAQKLKRNKSINSKAQFKDQPIMQVKKKHHGPSKSNIENIDKKLNNSPIYKYIDRCEYEPIQQPEHFSFTNLLQASNRNKQKYGKQSVENDNKLLNQNKPKIHTINLCPKKQGQLYVPYESSQFRKQKGQKPSQNQIKAEKHESTISYSAHSVEKKQSKSPYRLVNANKLTNTPNLKKNKNKIETQQESKTFMSILKSNQMGSCSKRQKQMKLQCSQKLQRSQARSTNEDYRKSIKNMHTKSNLLSTGLINLSGPNDFIERYSLNRQNIDSLIGNSKRNSDLSCQEGSNSCEEIVNSLRERLQLVVQCLLNKKNKIDIVRLIQESNPQINEEEISGQINELKTLKYEFQNITNDVLNKIQIFSKNMLTMLNQQIQKLQESQQTQIHWKKLQEKIQWQSQIDTKLFKCQLIDIKLNNLAEQINKNFLKTPDQSLQSYIDTQIKFVQNDLKSQQQNCQKLVVNKNSVVTRSCSQKICLSKFKDLQDSISLMFGWVRQNYELKSNKG